MASAVYVHELSAPLEAVEGAILAESTLDELARALPEVASAWEEERREAPGDRIFRAARFVARLTPPLFRRVLDGARLEWREEVRWDRRRHAGVFRIVPNLVPARAAVFRCEGGYRLVRTAGGTRRIVEVEVEVALRVMGPTIERVVLAPLPHHFDVEAEVLGRLAR